jgi:hypothetical protein
LHELEIIRKIVGQQRMSQHWTWVQEEEEEKEKEECA